MQEIEEFNALDAGILRILIVCKVIASANYSVALIWLGLAANRLSIGKPDRYV
ncbi:hypothetical protein [Pseudomonas koreensis]|jgi:hypothetical protein|uniref:hypothetical protein n=1 Tax=Pseudomonas koreensis TaxID=198620 RepID=UPI002FC83A7E